MNSTDARGMTVRYVRQPDADLQPDPLAPSWHGYSKPRPKLLRMCTIALRGDHWPDRGEGVWLIAASQFSNKEQR